AGAAADPRMDVYALGGLLLFALTGRHPDGPSSSAATGGLPAAAAATLGPVIARARALDPAHRTASAAALGRELAAVAARLALPPAPREDLPPEERTWRGAVALLAAVATAVALYAAIVSFTPRAQPAEDTIPFTAFGNLKLPDGRVLTRA